MGDRSVLPVGIANPSRRGRLVAARSRREPCRGDKSPLAIDAVEGDDTVREQADLRLLSWCLEDTSEAPDSFFRSWRIREDTRA